MSRDSLDSILENRRSQPHQLIEVLHDMQVEKGYISREGMLAVSRELGVPVIDVARVANFYKAFALQPRGKHIITLCLGTACHVRGANPLLEQALSFLNVKAGETTKDRLFTVETVNCLGTCALGPVVVLNGVYHKHMNPAKLRALLEKVKKSETKGGRDA